MAARARKREPTPTEELGSLERDLAGGLLPAYVLRGEERYFRERAARAIEAAAATRSIEVVRHDVKDPEFDLSRLLDDLAGGALFSSARCVVVHHADSLIKKGAKRYTPALASAINSRLATKDGGVVVLAAETLRADHALVKALVAAGGRVVGCRKLWDTPPPWNPDPRQAELCLWLVARARELAVRLSNDEAAYVVAATGNDLYALEGQLARLGDRGSSSLAELVGWNSGGTPWELAETLVDGDLRRSVAGLEALFAAGFHARDGTRTVDRGGLVAMLVSALAARLREAASGAAALAAGEGMPAAMAAAGVSGPPRAKAAFEARVQRQSASEWRRRLEEACALESRSRSGARVDANDFAALALAWYRRAPRAKMRS